MFATITDLPELPIRPEINSIEWRQHKQPYSHTSKSGFAVHKREVIYSRGVCNKTGIQVSRMTIERLITELNKTTIHFWITDEWQIAEHKYKLRSSDEFGTQLEWTDPIMGMMTFSQQEYLMPADIKVKWGYRPGSYGRQMPRDIPTSKWEWIEDGFKHTIQKFEGTKVQLEDSILEEQRTYWLHTRSDGDSQETIDWKNEVTTYEGEIIAKKVISSPNRVETYYYDNPQGLISAWEIEQDETRQYFHFDSEGRCTSYSKYEEEKGLRIDWVHETRMWLFLDLDKDGRLIREYYPILDGQQKLKLQNGLLHITDGTVKWWMKLSNLPQKMQESFSKIA